MGLQLSATCVGHTSQTTVNPFTTHGTPFFCVGHTVSRKKVKEKKFTKINHVPRIGPTGSSARAEALGSHWQRCRPARLSQDPRYLNWSEARTNPPCREIVLRSDVHGLILGARSLNLFLHLVLPSILGRARQTKGAPRLGAERGGHDGRVP